MSNYNKYTMFYGYCINAKFDYINEIEKEPRYWGGMPEFSLNYGWNKIGYKKVADCLGKEELYFGIELLSCDEYEETPSKYFRVDDLKSNFAEQINEKYKQLFKEEPMDKIQVCFICECI